MKIKFVSIFLSLSLRPMFEPFYRVQDWNGFYLPNTTDKSKSFSETMESEYGDRNRWLVCGKVTNSKVRIFNVVSGVMFGIDPKAIVKATDRKV